LYSKLTYHKIIINNTENLIVTSLPLKKIIHSDMIKIFQVQKIKLLYIIFEIFYDIDYYLILFLSITFLVLKPKMSWLTKINITKKYNNIYIIPKNT